MVEQLQHLPSVMMHRFFFISLFLVCALCRPSGSYAQTLKVDKTAYRSVYDLSLQCPVQCEWTIHSTDIGSIKREPSWTFRSDIPNQLAIATHQDYTGSGYDRGHLCPAHDRSRSLTAMRSTFSMSNICPQVPMVNRGAWRKTEDLCRALAVKHDSVAVVVVPVFLHRDTTFIGRHHLAVPHAFFKAAWKPATDEVVGTWFIFNHK